MVILTRITVVILELIHAPKPDLLEGFVYYYYYHYYYHHYYYYSKPEKAPARRDMMRRDTLRVRRPVSLSLYIYIYIYIYIHKHAHTYIVCDMYIYHPRTEGAAGGREGAGHRAACEGGLQFAADLLAGRPAGRPAALLLSLLTPGKLGTLFVLASWLLRFSASLHLVSLEPFLRDDAGEYWVSWVGGGSLLL